MDVRVIPVLDLLAGRAVLARRGVREAYAPVHSTLVPDSAAGDALALARAFRDALGCDEWYVADLDAIGGAAPQRPLVRGLVGLGGRVLLDAGVAGPDRARAALADGAHRVVVGLETLPSFALLGDVVRAIGPARLVFSLDLRAGQPVTHADAGPHATPLELVRAATQAGAAALLVLDLARVGTGLGVDLELVGAIRRAHPAVELLAGGGIASRRDVARLAEAGADGALVATALHDGSVGRDDIEAVWRRGGLRRGGHLSDSR